jgi:hypothetical protein
MDEMGTMLMVAMNQRYQSVLHWQDNEKLFE